MHTESVLNKRDIYLSLKKPQVFGYPMSLGSSMVRMQALSLTSISKIISKSKMVLGLQPSNLYTAEQKGWGGGRALLSKLLLRSSHTPPGLKY